MSRSSSTAIVFVGVVLFGVLLFVTRPTVRLQPAASKQDHVQPPYNNDPNNGREYPQPAEAGSSHAGMAAGKEVAGEGMHKRDPSVESYPERLLSHSDRQVRAVFERGLDLIGRGNFTEARRAFQEIIENNEDSTVRAAAQWAIGFAYYMEGGTENLCLAAGRFGDFLARSNSLKPDVLVEAAQINFAIISMELMYLLRNFDRHCTLRELGSP